MLEETKKSIAPLNPQDVSSIVFSTIPLNGSVNCTTLEPKLNLKGTIVARIAEEQE